MSLDRVLAAQPRLEPGHVWLVGAGPGDVGHLTIRALAGLGQADVIVHDALIGEGVLELARPGARLVHAGKRGGRPSARQADIIETMIALARSGERVLRLKGGDPFVFGRGGEEAIALVRAGIACRIVPGLTAGLAGLASVSIPSTLRGVNRAVVLATGQGEGGAGSDPGLDWGALARLGQPIVLYMAQHTLDGIVEAMLAGGAAEDMPAAVVWAATRPAERILVSTLGRVVETVRQARETEALDDWPAIVVLGEIVRVRNELLGLLATARAG